MKMDMNSSENEENTKTQDGYYKECTKISELSLKTGRKTFNNSTEFIRYMLGLENDITDDSIRELIVNKRDVLSEKAPSASNYVFVMMMLLAKKELSRSCFWNRVAFAVFAINLYALVVLGSHVYASSIAAMIMIVLSEYITSCAADVAVTGSTTPSSVTIYKLALPVANCKTLCIVVAALLSVVEYAKIIINYL